MNKILLVHLGFGPTYKKRLLRNLKTNDAYDRYDVLLLTDDVEYWSELKDKTNIFVEDIDLIRKDSPWSIELEGLPEEKRDEIKYADEILTKNFKFPTLLYRFCFIWERAQNYDGFMWLNTDVVPLKNDFVHQNLLRYFVDKQLTTNMFGFDINLPKQKIIMSPSAGVYDFHHSYLIDYAKKFNEKFNLNKSFIENRFNIMDGNFITYNFPDKTHYKPFFELFNNIIKYVLENKIECIHLGQHSIWSTHQEYITSILYNLLDGEGIPAVYNLNGICYNKGNFSLECYPEDRFWSWDPYRWICDPEAGQEGFIKNNYDKLKTFYENHGQVWPY